MKLLRLIPIALTLPLLASAEPVKPDWSPVQTKIQSWHTSQKAAPENTPSLVLRVVCFHGNDMEPFPNYVDRLTCVMDDISDFYRDGMRMHGFTCEDGLPLEKDKDGKLALLMVKAQHEAKHYDYDSGKETEKEIRVIPQAKGIDIEKLNESLSKAKK